MEADLRKVMISFLTLSDWEVAASMVSTAFTDAGEKTKLEFLARVEITFPARNIDTSFCFFIASTKSISVRDGLGITCDLQSFYFFFFGLILVREASSACDLRTFSLFFFRIHHVGVCNRKTKDVDFVLRLVTRRLVGARTYAHLVAYVTHSSKPGTICFFVVNGAWIFGDSR